MSVVTEKETQVVKFAKENQCLCFNLRKSSRIITQIYEDLFKPISLTGTQISILACVNKFQPISISLLAEGMATDRTTLTRNLKPLERDGYLKVQVGIDRRAREVAITPKGKVALEKAGKIFKHFQEKVEEKVGLNRLEKLFKELSLTLEVLQKD